MDLYFVTGNINKFNEARKIIPCLKQLDMDLVEVQEIDAQRIIEAKLLEAQKTCAGAMIVEDTSLDLACINGLPGPLIKWFIASIGTEGIYDLVQKYGNDRAMARTIIGHMTEDGRMYFYEGVVKGRIVSPRGQEGFGWDHIFMPDGHDRTYAEMPTEEKNACSSRATAFCALRACFEKEDISQY